MIFLSVLYSKAASMQTADVHSSVAAEHRSAAAFDSRVPWKLNGHCRANAGWLLKGDDSWPRWTCLAYRISCLPSIYRCNFICMRSQAKSTVLNKEAESHNAERKQVEENYRYWCRLIWYSSNVQASYSAEKILLFLKSDRKKYLKWQ